MNADDNAGLNVLLLLLLLLLLQMVPVFPSARSTSPIASKRAAKALIFASTSLTAAELLPVENNVRCEDLHNADAEKLLDTSTNTRFR